MAYERQPRAKEAPGGQKSRVSQLLLPCTHNSAVNLPGPENFGDAIFGGPLGSGMSAARFHNSGSNLRGVMKKFLVGIFLGIFFAALVGGARAADEPKKAPEFVPIVVDRAQYEAVMQHLNGMTFKDALPLVKWLSELEERAKRQWEADNNPKPEVPK